MHTKRRAAVSVLAIGVLAALTFAGCSNDNNNNNNPVNPNPNPTPTGAQYRGVIAGPTSSGTLDINIATTGTTSAPAGSPGSYRLLAQLTSTGTITPDSGAAVALTGAYNDSSKALALTGGGWTLNGSKVSSGALQGTYTGPKGPGVFTADSVGAAVDSVRAVLGTFTSTSGGPNGIFNFTIRDSTIHGTAVDTTGNSLPLNGTFTATGGGISIRNPALPGGAPLATGTLAADGSASGTYDNGAGNSGTWTGHVHHGTGATAMARSILRLRMTPLRRPVR
jgi:hypothetical protein